MLIAADHVPFTEQNPAQKHQLPVMFRILFNCGLRTSELLNLRMCDVDLKENVFAILDTKFHKNRLVPFSDSLSEALTQYLERFPSESPDSFIFPSSSPRSNGGRYGNSWLQTQFRQLLRMAGIPYNGPGKVPRLHDIRHTKAMHMVQANVNPVFIKDYLGHADISTTEVYARADNEAKRAALEKATAHLDLPKASHWEQDTELIEWLSSLG